MTSDKFTTWLAAMKTTFGYSMTRCGTELGVNRNTMRKYKNEGCDRKTWLACMALFHRLDRRMD